MMGELQSSILALYLFSQPIMLVQVISMVDQLAQFLQKEMFNFSQKEVFHFSIKEVLAFFLSISVIFFASVNFVALL